MGKGCSAADARPWKEPGLMWTRMGGDAPGRACSFEVLLGTELPKARRENLGTEKKRKEGLLGGCTSPGGGGVLRSELGSDFSRGG